MELKFLALLLFAINPLGGICMMYIVAWRHDKDNSNLYILCSMLAIYLGFINATKVPVSDMENYQSLFLAVPQHDYFSYLMISGKEPIYSTFAYMSYYCFLGSWITYVIAFTAIYYMLIYNSIVILGRKYGCLSSTIVTAIIICSFFFQVFIMSGHLVRQCLSEAFFIYFMVRRYVLQKRSWGVAALAIGIHSTTILLLGITLLTEVKKKKGLNKVLIGGPILILAVFFYLPNLTSIPFVGYIFTRLISENLINNDSYVESGIPLIGLIFMAGIFVANLITKKRNLSSKKRAIINPITNICMGLILILFIFVVSKLNYLATRFFFILYSYIGLIILFLFDDIKSKLYTKLKIASLPLFLFYFMYSIDHAPFEFKYSALDFIFLPLFYYF